MHIRHSVPDCCCRYPAFVDALRDLDDPLTMTHLFATLPAESTHDIPAKVVANARRLSMEFQAYVVRAHALRKVFVSVKGFYYQADIQGQAVTWLVPHNLAQVSNQMQLCSLTGSLYLFLHGSTSLLLHDPLGTSDD